MQMGIDQSRARKSFGAYYTPKVLADFVSTRILAEWRRRPSDRRIRILDPAVGDGELLCSMLSALRGHDVRVDVVGFETDLRALRSAGLRLRVAHPNYRYSFKHADFLAFTLKHYRDSWPVDPSPNASRYYDVVIANPPYVRTQLMGAHRSRTLADSFALAGRIDLYQAFIQAIARVLLPGGIAGIIVSNRFMTTKTGSSVRQSILENFRIAQVWDLGDTRLFEAAVLPAILIVEKNAGQRAKTQARFTSIYSTNSGKATATAENAVQALTKAGIIRVEGGGLFHVRHGSLDHGESAAGIWRLVDEKARRWLSAVNKRSVYTFKDIGKVRVGVKTCADSVYIRNDWDTLSDAERPELLFRLTTHHVARRYKPLQPGKYQIVYPHTNTDGRREAVDLSRYPKTGKYLSQHRERLEKRQYILAAGRQWYELWVPQEPDLWNRTKLVFRDISEQPTFWMDLDGSIVNGDCYWLVCDRECDSELLWLALGVANSSFTKEYYDLRFANRLYAGRRRFIKQYVEEFPLPDPDGLEAQRIAQMAKDIFDLQDQTETEEMEKELDCLVRRSFGV